MVRRVSVQIDIVSLTRDSCEIYCAYGREIQPKGFDICSIVRLHDVLLLCGRDCHVDYVSSTFQIGGDRPGHRLMGRPGDDCRIYQTAKYKRSGKFTYPLFPSGLHFQLA